MKFLVKIFFCVCMFRSELQAEASEDVSVDTLSVIKITLKMDILNEDLLVFELKNVSEGSLKVPRHALDRQMFMILLVPETTFGGDGLLEFIAPAHSYGEVELEAGGYFKKTLDLSESFPKYSKIVRERNFVLFWSTLTKSPIDQETLRFGGVLYINKH